MAVKIPDQFYCGVRADGLGFITPDGTDQAAKKRKDTVNHWTQGYCQKNPSIKLDDPKHFFTIKNTPTSGFILKHSVTRYRTQNKLFEIEDPRGFRIQINAENLADVCLQGGVHHGHLEGTYVYGREGSDNVLLPTGSPIFKEAFELTKAVKSDKLSLRDLKIGQRVELLHQNEKVECLYVGRRWHVNTPWAQYEDCTAGDLNAQKRNNSDYWRRHRHQSEWFRRVYRDVIEKPRHMFLPIPKEGVKQNWLLNPSSPHVLKILEQGYKTEAETETALAAYNGKVIRKDVPSQWQLRDGYHAEPDHISLYALTKAEAEAELAKRKPYLDTFKQEWISGTKHAK